MAISFSATNPDQAASDYITSLGLGGPSLSSSGSAGPGKYAGIGSLISGLGQTLVNSSANSGISDLLHNQEQQNYDQSKQYYDAYSGYLDRLQAAQQANMGAASANARARQAAAAATERARQQAEKKGLHANLSKLNQAYGLFAPARDAYASLIPQAANTYSKGLSGINLLTSYLTQPEQIARLQQPVPAIQQNIPLPAYLTGDR